MDDREEKPFAWQPLTVRGVAAFASAGWGRLLLVQLVFAMLAAAAVTVFVSRAWCPMISEAICQLPSSGAIRLGSLNWPGPSPQRLAEGHFLALTVDLSHQGEARSPAHLQVEFGQNDCHLLSLFGACPLPYPQGWTMAFNRPEVEPWWGAWQPVLLGLTALGILTGLLLVWQLLATLYLVPVWLLTFFANRDLSLRASWRLAGAALMPGALFMTGSIVAYSLGLLELPRLLLAGALHLLIGWLYLVLSPLSLPLASEMRSGRRNPFLSVPDTSPPAPVKAQGALGSEVSGGD